MEFQTEARGQDEPAGNLLLLAGCGHGVGQLFQDTLLEAALKEIAFIGLADNFNVVELSPPESLENFLGLVFDERQVHGGELGGGQLTC